MNTLRLETAKRNIKVITVLPGPVSTEVFENALTNVVNVVSIPIIAVQQAHT